MKMATANSLEIRQSEKYEGDEWWSWSVWVEGPDSELDEIDFVEYTLHPTFRKPVREIRDRSSKFMLSTAGWGGFRIFVRIAKKDQREIRLRHDLTLYYPSGRATDT
jgi:transcription initiation factor IIF auxiliary subunit